MSAIDRILDAVLDTRATAKNDGEALLADAVTYALHSQGNEAKAELAALRGFVEECAGRKHECCPTTHGETAPYFCRTCRALALLKK